MSTSASAQSEPSVAGLDVSNRRIKIRISLVFFFLFIVVSTIFVPYFTQGVLMGVIQQKSDLTAHASYRSTFLVVRNADHCLRLPAFSSIMVWHKITDTKRGTETNRRQMHKDGTARSLLAAGLIRCLDGTIHAREGC